MLNKCFRKSALSRTQIFEWPKTFSDGGEVIENLAHANRPRLLMTITTKKFKKQCLKIMC